MKVDLPAPGGPEMPMPGCRAGMRQQGFDQPLGLGAVVGPGRSDQRDRPGQRPPIAGPQRTGVSAGAAAPRHEATGSERRPAGPTLSCWRAHIAA